MISWKARETSACEAHAARRYHLSSLRPQSGLPIVCNAGAAKGAHSIRCVGL
jgi:hypothetical protein